MAAKSKRQKKYINISIFKSKILILFKYILYSFLIYFRVPDWVQYMQTQNSALEIFKRANGGYMLRDTSRTLRILSIHAELQTSNICHSNPYYRATTKENTLFALWVPLLPGY